MATEWKMRASSPSLDIVADLQCRIPFGASSHGWGSCLSLVMLRGRLKKELKRDLTVGLRNTLCVKSTEWSRGGGLERESTFVAALQA